MIKKISISTLLLYSISTFSQTQIKVLDAENQKPIPYAKIILKGKDYYKNTSENGELNLEKDEEISEIESFGYENLNVQKNTPIFLLEPKFNDIEKIEISKPTFSKTYIIGNTKERSLGFTSGTRIWSVTNFFGNKHKEEKTFIKKIRMLTEVKAKKPNAVFNLVFYENVEGKPSSEKLKNVVVTCKKGKNTTEIDFSKNPITFPKEGLFIGVEWIMNEQNHYQEKMTILHKNRTKEKNIIVDRVNPTFFGLKSSSSNVFGRSHETQKDSTPDVKIAKAYSLSIELEVTN